MDNNDLGESSCKKHSHGDNNPNGRPLKKAKFPWQVKGKYHLKDRDEAMDDDSTADEDTSSDKNDEETGKINQPNSAENNFDNKVEENLEMLGDYLLKQDFSSLNNLLFGPEIENKSSKKVSEDNSTSSDQSASTAYPKYTYIKVPINNNNNDSGESSSDVDVSNSSDTADCIKLKFYPTARGTSKFEDHCLKRWQARQLAKGYVDNTINRVLDSWSVAPLPPNLDENHHLNFDVASLLDDLAGNEGIENEGILMAISAHGLQNNQTDHHRVLHFHPTYLDPCENETIVEFTEDDLLDRQNVLDDVDGYSNLKVEDKSSDNEPERPVTEPPAWKHLSEGCNCSNVHQVNNHANVPPIPFHRRNHQNINQLVDNVSSEPIVTKVETPKETVSTSSSQYSNAKNPTSNSNNNEYSSSTTQAEDQFEDQFDFLDAAVSYAIQAKGLIPFN